MNYRLAFISGASSGLGRELARLLARKGIPLFLTARQRDALEELKQELEEMTSVTIHVYDLSSDLTLLSELIALHTPDLIINNAGIGLYGDMLSYPVQEQMKILQVNVDALVRICLEGAHALQAKGQKGTILNISSMAGHFIYPYFALYAASKRFVKHFSLSADAELRSKGIRVLVSVLGRFESPFLKKTGREQRTKNSWDVMSLEKTALAVLRQIEKQKRVCIIDYRYKLLQFFSYFVPKSFVTFLLKRNFE